MVIVGIDEAGRGSWAGPVVAAAVVLASPIPGVTDSKVLSREKREQLAVTIKQNSFAFCVGWATNEEVDSLGLTAAVAKAMREALAGLPCQYDAVIIDGNYNFLPEVETSETRIKADLYVAEVSAASIIAKVERDTFMRQQAVQYPQYSFDSHVGYGTADHQREITQHGVCALHRMTYKPVMRAIEGARRA